MEEAFSQPLFKWILLLSSIGVYVFIIIALILKRSAPQKASSQQSTTVRGSGAEGIGAGDMLAMFDYEEEKSDLTSQSVTDEDESEQAYEALFDTVITRVQNRGDSTNDIIPDDGEDSDEEDNT